MDRKGEHIKQGDLSATKDGESRADRSQSVHSSDEAGNDRGAKGRRKVET